jgi:hypothetical protein
MGVAAMHGRTLRATLCEIERGVFYATYSGAAADTDELVIYQIGTSAEEAKERIESSAHALGYETVIWEQTITAPLFASQVKATFREPTAAYARRFDNDRGMRNG